MQSIYRKLFLPGLVALTVLFLSSFFIHNKKGADKLTALELIKGMADSVEKIRTMRFHLKSLERINDKFLSAESDIKLEVNPRRLYFRNPAKKLEILYRQGEHNNQALVKPHVFPYTALYLDPAGSLMRKNQHYTINELGFGFIAKTIKSIIVKDPENSAKNMSYLGVMNRAGQRCHMIMYENKQFGYFDYTVGKNESVSTIALKKFLSDYMIRNKNDLSSYYGDIKEGKVIRLPNNYCYKATLFISEKTLLPVAINIYDEKDLWESYEYSNVIVNNPIDQAEFTRSYKEYGF